ncbi:hypothetical protein ES332_A04G030000v1 [Gossypium tomentosum]|uniref:Uncharacterized protein n=1 Tax=Gossypium tomentosum TaxID=34277 RepID=A0A5D2QXI3_GOSTO|nr:hypothetical protein ES332_A04G030000v1 [Gossypium tomentosum]
MSADFEVSPKLKQNQAIYLIQRAIGIGFLHQRLKKEIFQIRQSKRKKKALNKKIRSMRKIQDTTLTTKEKKKRDRGLRKQNGKGILRINDSIANLSLSDSDVSNSRRVLLREAKKT